MSSKSLLALAGLGLLAACAEPPMGPASDQTVGTVQPPGESQKPPSQPYCSSSSDLKLTALRALPSSGAVAYEKQCTPVR